MSQLTAFAIGVATIFCGTIHAQSPTTVPPRLTHQWQHIASLPAGTPVLVRELFAPNPTPCILAWIDNNAVACDGPDGRVIYTATSLAAIAPDTPPSHVPVGLIIATSAGAIIGGIAGSNGTAGTTAAGVFIGAGFLGGIAAASAAPEIGPYRSTPAGIRIPLRAPRRRAPIFP